MFYLAFLFMKYQDLSELMSVRYIIVLSKDRSSCAVIWAILKS